MRLVLTSDTHEHHPTIPEGDVLIHCGDFACGDDVQSLRRDVAWLASLPHRHKILTLGNHDLILRNPAHKRLLGSIRLLEDQAITINGVRFFGIAWNSTPAIPEGTDVVISHRPPLGILDGKHQLGCSYLRRAIEKINPRLVVCGHVHECRGRLHMGQTDYYNVSSCATVVTLPHEGQG